MLHVPAQQKLPHVRLQQNPTSMAPFRACLPDKLILKYLREEGFTWRDRVYTPVIVFWGMIAQFLGEDHSCKTAVARIREWVRARKAPGQRRNRRVPEVSIDDGSYCRARARLPLRLLSVMGQLVGRDLSQRCPKKDKLWGRDIYLVDGATVSMPDTPELVKEFGKHHGGVHKRSLPFPIAQLVGLICLNTGAVVDLAIGAYKKSEQALFQQIWKGAAWLKGTVIVGDSLYGSYGQLAALLELGIDMVSRPTTRRICDFRKGKVLGKGDRLVSWQRPKHHPLWLDSKKRLAQLLTLRLIDVHLVQKGFRAKHITLVTTLLDPHLYPREEIAGLYLRRWDIEVDLRHLKSVMGMKVLGGKTPDIVRKEIWAVITAYNLIRRVMWESAVPHGFSPSGLEFQRDAPTAEYLTHANRVRPLFAFGDLDLEKPTC